VVGVLPGRDAERSALGSWLDESLLGSPRVVWMSGEAGSGKTRLLDQFVHDAGARGVATATGRAVEQDGAPPFWPWRLVLRELDANDLLASSHSGDLPSRRFAVFEDIASLLGERAGASGGLVIGIDDVHRMDLPSMRLLAHLATNLRSVPLMLVVTHRPATAVGSELNGLLDEVVGVPARRQLVVRDLDREAVAQVLGETVPAAVSERVHDLTGGNALFVSELARHLRDGSGVDEIPDSLRTLIRERLATRSVPFTDMLRTASVAGREFAAAVVANATGRTVLDTLTLLDEATGAGLVQPAREPGRFRFTHLLVRDIIEATTPAQQLPMLHRRVAEAIETYEGTGDDQLHDLARHWEHASVLGDAGDAGVAAEWSERAAAAADRALAWEEAARLYERSLALSPAGLEPEVRHRRLMGAARGLLHGELLSRSVARCAEAADVALAAGRPDLAADAALVIEGRGGSGGDEVMVVLDIAERALSGLDALDHTRRARVLGLLAALYFYVDPTRCERLSEDAAFEASRSDSPLATVAAARARQMIRFGPQHAEERLTLARRIGDAGRTMNDPGVTLWEPLWRIDALLELGRVREAGFELPSLRRLAAATRHPMSRWHLMRSEATIAAATGRWDDARHYGTIARDLHARQEGPEVADSLELALQTTIGIHVGFPPDVLADYDRIDLTLAPAYVDDIPTLLPLPAKIALGRRIEAEREYDRLAPVDEWAPPPFLWLPIHTIRLLAAFELDRRDDIASILGRLEPHRGRHIAGGGGPISYFGCVELYLGHGRLVLGDLDLAVADLRVAVGAAVSATTPPFEMRAAVLLAEALQARAGPRDTAEAQAIATTYQSRAAALGMEPWRARLEDVARGPEPPVSSVLSPRELEVAGLVARGLTNDEIAAALFISNRTAQNHVQHILTKLDLSNRTQIATWHHDHVA
jgi:DNA-binding CsgD family transcriptional regulator